MLVEIEEGHRQMILLAIAKLSIERPGWLWTLEQLALTMDNHTPDGKAATFRQLRQFNQTPFNISPTAPLMVALDESVKLQSHYAELLNAYDKGKRMQFKDAEAWITRLIKTGKFETKEDANG